MISKDKNSKLNSNCVLASEHEKSMIFENRASRLNFLKYAFTSESQMHSISEIYRQKALEYISQGKEIEDPVEDLFTTGVVNLEKLSKAKDEKRVSTRTTDNYFLGLHNKISECKAYVGTVESLKGKSALVRVGEGIEEYEKMLAPSTKPGDKVIVHGKYVVKKA